MLEDEATKLVETIEGGREDKAGLITKLLGVEQQVRYDDTADTVHNSFVPVAVQQLMSRDMMQWFFELC